MTLKKGTLKKRLLFYKPGKGLELLTLHLQDAHSTSWVNLALLYLRTFKVTLKTAALLLMDNLLNIFIIFDLYLYISSKDNFLVIAENILKIKNKIYPLFLK